MCKLGTNQLVMLVSSVIEKKMISLCIYTVLGGMIVFLMSEIVRTCRQSYKQTANVPPGSEGFPIIGETLHFLAAINSGKGFYQFVRSRRLRYGNCFRTRIFGETHAFVSTTEAAKAILNNETGRFTKKYIRSIGELVGEHSLLCASHHHHRLIRSRLLALFSATSVSLLAQQFDELVVRTLRDWERRGTVIVLREALEITFKAMCKMLISLENEKELEMKEDVARVCEAMLAFPLRLPWSRFYKGLQARKRFMSKLDKEISDRRKGLKASPQDFLQHLLADDEGSSTDGTKLSDAEIRDNILTMIIAGQDTTASAITWMVKYLDENERVKETVIAEQFRVAENLSPQSLLTLEDLNGMSYANKVVKESLRMASIVPWFPRQVLKECEIEGFRIKRGWNVNVDARSIHFDPVIYKEPEIFNPSRFSEESKPYSFLAFGMGGRTCLGMNMAKAMMLIFLHRLVTTYSWKVTDPDSRLEKQALFSRLRSGCPIHVMRFSENVNL